VVKFFGLKINLTKRKERHDMEEKVSERSMFPEMVPPQPQPWFELALRYLDRDQQRTIVARMIDLHITGTDARRGPNGERYAEEGAQNPVILRVRTLPDVGSFTSISENLIHKE
jgi:hypothetical protein